MIDYILECEAASKKEAEEMSLNLLQVDASEINCETVTGGSGLKRLFKSQSVVLRVKPRNENLSQEVIARGILHTILYKLKIEASLVDIQEKEGNMYFYLESPQSAKIIGRHGRGLDSLQFILNLLVSKWTRHGKNRIILEVSDYRKKRKISIEAICEKMADKVCNEGRGVTLSYMSPYERRIVHLALEKDKDVYTESIGSGVYKRVKILPYEDEDDDGDYEEDSAGNQKDYDEEYYDDNNGTTDDGNDRSEDNLEDEDDSDKPSIAKADEESSDTEVSSDSIVSLDATDESDVLDDVVTDGEERDLEDDKKD